MKEQLIDFVKAMSDADRLRILGVLARRSASRSEIAARLHMPESNINDHLAFLAQVGVIDLKEDQYLLNTTNMNDLARSQLSKDREVYVPAPELDEPSRKVLVSCLNPDGTIKQLPSQAKKLKIILNYIINAISPGVFLTEKEINTIIRHFHADVSGLRRDLVDARLLERERDGSRYWRSQGQQE
ncbi:MAG: DUF2087 domain-containing protein [Anaerolineales bacterium]|nr:DUF2087 domain-containing protein [Anaerolineales bacterium]